ncbi:extracellular solute-binding protein [Galbitalea sp. SE-J8]|uniref:ABC transporter substrate-binding protein n=1 Tax=Galbitalea sp. SE-J8 TaxID=3054952 RepID=UPI00259C6F5B|nr:extracellular solute-binding protein [Galbitalea sp. SE-J8]MDM4762034.1 extracellular solute-binding protein [Galbitalea sp. SE-J8]
MAVSGVSRIRARSRGRRAAAVASVIAIAAMTAACGSSAPGGKGTLNLWYGLESTDPDKVQEYQTLYVDPFEAQHPDVTVHTTPLTDKNFTTKVKTSLAAGRGPDIIETAGSTSAIPYAEAGYFLDLGPLAEREHWKDSILPWAFDMSYIDGKLQAIPSGYESMVLYYNTTLFEKHGWQPPTDRASLEKLADEMIDAGVVPFGNGAADYEGVGEWILSSFFNEVAGPRRINQALNDEIAWTDPAFVDTVKLVQDYFERGYFAGGTKQYFTLSFPQVYANFADGKAGMLLSGSWEMGSLPEYFGVNGNSSDWDWVALPPLAPDVPSDVYPLSVGNTLSVNAKAGDVDVAQDYLAWYLSDTANMWKAVAKTGGNPIPIRFEPSDVPADIDPRYAAQYTAINEASDAGMVGYVTWTSWGSGAETYIWDNMDKLFTGELSAATFCAGMDAAFQKDYDAGTIPPVFGTAVR